MFIICGMVLCVFILLQYQAYLGRQEDSLGYTYVNDDLSVNYLSGKSYQLGKNILEFSITNQSSDPMFYYVHLTNISGSTDGVTYKVTSTNEDFETIESNLSRTVIVSRYELKPMETHRYYLSVNNPLNSDLKFEIETDIDEMDETFASTILASQETTEDASAIGLIEKLEQYGTMYYFHGNVENNYVSFAGLLWRIVKINEDKTVKLVLNNTSEELVKMKEENNETPYAFNDSLVKEYLNTWYENYLGSVDSQIVSTLYCYDDSMLTDENNRIEYLSNIRIFDEKMPTNACGGTTLSEKVALLTADEVMFAGGDTIENKDYYLYKDSLQASWWTMTPNKKENNNISYIAVSPDGSLTRDISESSGLFVRPVITLAKKVKVTGLGTMDNPYVIESK